VTKFVQIYLLLITKTNHMRNNMAISCLSHATADASLWMFMQLGYFTLETGFNEKGTFKTPLL